MPRFSVVITTHQRPRLLARALASIKSQSHPHIQIVVVSDTPCPDTFAVAARMLTGPDRFLQRCDQPGPAVSRNVGMTLIDGDFVVFLDDDDAFTEGFFANVAAHVSPDEVLYTDYHVVFEREENDTYVPLSAELRGLAARHIDELHVRNFIPLHCVVYPVDILRRCTFDPDLTLNEDWDFLLAISRQAPFRYVPIEGPVLYARDRPDNRGRSNNHLLVETYRKIYSRWPAPKPAIASARLSFFAAHGLEAALSDL